MELGLKERVVIITGPAKGMGEAVTLAFASEGCRLAHECIRSLEHGFQQRPELSRLSTLLGHQGAGSRLVPFVERRDQFLFPRIHVWLSCHELVLSRVKGSSRLEGRIA